MRSLTYILKKILSKLGYTILKTENFNSIRKRHEIEIKTLSEKKENYDEILKKLKLHTEIWPHIIPLLDHPVRTLQKEDKNYDKKTIKLIGKEKKFGHSDFSDICSYLFSSNLLNHKLIHQRIDEGSCLWRSVKSTKGDILEIGRAAGGSTLLILGASSDRRITSIDRDPFHSKFAQIVFDRPDVKQRLNLKIQSSREKIENKKFNMMFIDGDHSYEGVCHDIAMYWNSLEDYQNCKPLAVFHDAVLNPISYVPHVKKALDELIRERNVCKVVESWGSVLVLKKIGNINEKKWFLKTDKTFWGKKDSKHFKLSLSDSFFGDNNFDYHEHNIFSETYVKNHIPTLTSELESWQLNGLSINDPNFMAGGDNPVRFLIFDNNKGKKNINKILKVKENKLCFRVFFRPLNLYKVNFVLSRNKYKSFLIKVELNLNKKNKIINVKNNQDFKVLGVNCKYRNGYFDFSVNFIKNKELEELVFALEFESIKLFEGFTNGIYMNLSTLRKIL